MHALKEGFINHEQYFLHKESDNARKTNRSGQSAKALLNPKEGHGVSSGSVRGLMITAKISRFLPKSLMYPPPHSDP